MTANWKNKCYKNIKQTLQNESIEYNKYNKYVFKNVLKYLL